MVMSWLSRHLVAVAIVGVAVASMGAIFAFARPTYHPVVMPPPPSDLPYTAVTYTVADVRRAFADENLRLAPHVPRSESPGITTLWNRAFVLEVDRFGDPQQVKQSGFHDYFTIVNGRWVKAPRTCQPGATAAERWRGNVRVIVSCTRAGDASSTWLRRAEHALARL